MPEGHGEDACTALGKTSTGVHYGNTRLGNSRLGGRGCCDGGRGSGDGCLSLGLSWGRLVEDSWTVGKDLRSRRPAGEGRAFRSKRGPTFSLSAN